MMDRGINVIPKSELLDGATYRGRCRNGYRATWDATKQVFIYQRTKFTMVFSEEIKHVEDDDGFDTFKPYELI